VTKNFSGIGQNDPGRRQLQIEENTIQVANLTAVFARHWLTLMQSFLAAKDLGASYIEVRK